MIKKRGTYQYGNTNKNYNQAIDYLVIEIHSWFDHKVNTFLSCICCLNMIVLMTSQVISMNYKNNK